MVSIEVILFLDGPNLEAFVLLLQNHEPQTLACALIEEMALLVGKG